MSYYIPPLFAPWLREATPADALDLAPRLRALDVEECEKLSGQTPLEALQSGLGQGLCVAFTHPASGQVHALFGLAQGRFIWLLSDEAMFRDKTMRRAMTRLGRPLLWLLFQQAGTADIIFNLTLERNAKVLRWLRWLGAVTTPAVEVEVEGQRAVPFFFLRHDYQEEPCAAPQLYP